MKKLISMLMAGMIAASAFTGCARAAKEQEKPDMNVEKETVMDELEDGGYYILKGDTYEKLYAQNANFNYTDKSSYASTSRTLWFGDDWSKVPTVYKGDELVYKYSDVFSETFIIERFEYVGWTLGVSNLKPLESGRYYASTEADDASINPTSDATQIQDFLAEYVVIDKLGGAELRSGNISSGGCILGLEKDKKYKADVYEGTFLHEMVFTADSLALTSMTAYKTTDYDYLRSQLVRINIPEWFNSGYYLINGYGLIRYVNGTSYDADTDFNIPNIMPGSEDEEDTENWDEADMTIAKEGEVVDDQEIPFKVEKDSMVHLKFVYQRITELSADVDYRPIARIVGDTSIDELKPVNDHTMEIETFLPAGEYTFEIHNLMNRKYRYELETVPVDEMEDLEGESEPEAATFEDVTQDSQDSQDSGIEIPTDSADTEQEESK